MSGTGGGYSVWSLDLSLVSKESLIWCYRTWTKPGRFFFFFVLSRSTWICCIGKPTSTRTALRLDGEQPAINSFARNPTRWQIRWCWSWTKWRKSKESRTRKAKSCPSQRRRKGWITTSWFRLGFCDEVFLNCSKWINLCIKHQTFIRRAGLRETGSRNEGSDWKRSTSKPMRHIRTSSQTHYRPRVPWLSPHTYLSTEAS